MVGDLEARIAVKAAPCQRELDLLKSIDGFGDAVVSAWLAEIGPAPHEYFATHEKLASWVTLCPGNHMSAGKRKHGRTCDAGTYVKPMLVQAACEDAAGLRGQELPPGRAGPAGRRIDPGVVQDLPHCGHRDPVAELDELALHTPVTPVGLSAAMRITSLRIAACSRVCVRDSRLSCTLTLTPGCPSRGLLPT